MNTPVFDKEGSSVKLDDISPEPPKGVSREEAEARLAELGQELFELQDLLFAARTHSVLVVLQGRYTAGKDGTIKHVVGYLNPRGVQVVSYGVPSKEEVEHDFLWRIHRNTPRKGEFSIFNRSHYEDVLVVRVHNLVPGSIWKERYGHIRGFEELLSESGTIILKYFLHISKDEQKQRLLAREKDNIKAWKLNPGDWKEREHWEDYTEAYEDVFKKTSTKHAPWTIVPGDAKWYRNFVIAESIVQALRPHKKEWLSKLEADGARAKAELEAYRHQRGNGR